MYTRRGGNRSGWKGGGGVGRFLEFGGLHSSLSVITCFSKSPCFKIKMENLNVSLWFAHANTHTGAGGGKGDKFQVTVINYELYFFKTFVSILYRIDDPKTCLINIIRDIYIYFKN